MAPNVSNQCTSKHSARSVPLNDSTYALSVGLLGREKSICTGRDCGASPNVGLEDILNG